MFPSEHVGTVVSFGQVAGALGGAIFQPIAGSVLQRAREMHTQSGFVPLFIYSGCAYLVALVLLRTLAPGLKRAELRATEWPNQIAIVSIADYGHGRKHELHGM